MKHGPWTSGPRELLDHAKDHLAKRTDVDNRFAMISVDNAVELIVKTYLRLPHRVTDLRLTRKQRDEHTKDFSSALTAIENLVPDRINTGDLGEIEYYHRIRNRLYHEGDGITVERDKVNLYLRRAEALMDALFPTDGGTPGEEAAAAFAETAGSDGYRFILALTHDLGNLGITAEVKKASISFKLPDPRGGPRKLTMLLVGRQRAVYVGWLPDQLAELGLPRGIGVDYFQRTASLFQNCSVHTMPAGGLRWSRRLSHSEFREEYDDFLRILAETVEGISEAAEGQA